MTSDKAVKPVDDRMLKPIQLNVKNDKEYILLQQSESFKVKGKEFSFLIPNNISLFLSISSKGYLNAKNIYKKIISAKLPKSKISFIKKELKELYNYFEEIQIGLLFMYYALEIFSNLAIPKNHKIKRLNEKNEKETWNKEKIIKMLSLSEIIGDILPEILKTESPKEKKFWQNFIKLENIRNAIINQKIINNTAIDTGFLKKFLDENIFHIINSGKDVLGFYCQENKSHPFFPLGFNNPDIPVIEVNDFEDYFELAKK
ncbi:MAG: hypothetical protein K8R58_02390 [Bacteroidales bacterium]|nr:hypothetical protein [Bacteroidales bacterium]